MNEENTDGDHGGHLSSQEVGLVCKVSFRPARVSRSTYLEKGVWGGANYKFNSNDYFICIGNNHRKDQREPEPENINTKLNKGDTEGEGRERGRTGRDRQT